MVIVPQCECQYTPSPIHCTSSHTCSAGVYIKWKRSKDHSYSFGDYQKQYSDVSQNADEYALQGDQIDKIMHQSVRDAVTATLEDDNKDGTFRKVVVNSQHTGYIHLLPH